MGSFPFLFVGQDHTLLPALFLLYYCSVHIASGKVLVRGEVFFSSKDWVNHKMKIMFIVDLKVTHFLVK